MATANLLQTSVSGGTQNALSLQGDGVFFPKASTTSRLALTLTTTDKGFIVYDTTDNNIYFWNGAAWESIPGSGDAGANGSVQYNDNGIVSGATNFVWDKVNGRVGIGTATPGETLDISAAAPRIRQTATTGTNGSLLALVNTGGTAYLGLDSSGAGLTAAYALNLYHSGAYPIVFSTTATERYRIDSTGISTWSVAGTTAMTLNSTGLGIGGSPVNPLTAYGASIAKAPVLFLTNVGSPGDYGWDFSVDGAVNGNLFIRRVNAYTKNDVLEFDRANGNIIMTPSTTATALTVNGQLTFNATSNTNLRFSYRGSDGTTRVANITLA